MRFANHSTFQTFTRGTFIYVRIPVPIDVERDDYSLLLEIESNRTEPGLVEVPFLPSNLIHLDDTLGGVMEDFVPLTRTCYHLEPDPG